MKRALANIATESSRILNRDIREDGFGKYVLADGMKGYLRIERVIETERAIMTMYTVDFFVDKNWQGGE